MHVACLLDPRRSMHHPLISGAALLAVFSFGVNGAADVPASLDKQAVSQALEAAPLTTCKKPGGPTGEGHVLVTVAPNGKITDALVDAPPFANTKAGKCIAKVYQKVRVPPFQGTPVVLGKKFKLE
jgi:hypothetical protein